MGDKIPAKDIRKSDMYKIYRLVEKETVKELQHKEERKEKDPKLKADKSARAKSNIAIRSNYAKIIAIGQDIPIEQARSEIKGFSLEDIDTLITQSGYTRYAIGDTSVKAKTNRSKKNKVKKNKAKEPKSKPGKQEVVEEPKAEQKKSKKKGLSSPSELLARIKAGKG